MFHTFALFYSCFVDVFSPLVFSHLISLLCNSFTIQLHFFPPFYIVLWLYNFLLCTYSHLSKMCCSQFDLKCSSISAAHTPSHWRVLLHFVLMFECFLHVHFLSCEWHVLPLFFYLVYLSVFTACTFLFPWHVLLLYFLAFLSLLLPYAFFPSF